MFALICSFHQEYVFATIKPNVRAAYIKKILHKMPVLNAYALSVVT